jgi:bifunctional DNA-binding transcriptional regulator/antitoxin component of YhaV-PrlF toxin-antitoxin module
MALGYSKLTAHGQISMVRSKLGVSPGSVLPWIEEDGKIVVRRAGRFSSEDLHRALFPKGAPKPRALEEMKKGVARHIKGRNAPP